MSSIRTRLGQRGQSLCRRLVKPPRPGIQSTLTLANRERDGYSSNFPDPNIKRDTYALTHRDGHSFADPDANSFALGDTYSFSHRGTYGKRDAQSFADGDTYAKCEPNSDSHAGIDSGGHIDNGYRFRGTGG
jgi:hypothetical protein